MGINNQFLAGSACLGIVALVVAIDTKRDPVLLMDTGEAPPDIPGDEDVKQTEKDLQTQIDRWDRVRIGQGDSLTEDECTSVLRTVKQIQNAGYRMFRQRAKHYPVDPAKQSFEEGISKLIDDVEQRKAKIVSNTPETVEVPVNKGAVVETEPEAPPASFVQDQGENDPIPDSHQTTPGELDDMVDEFAHQETSVAVTGEKRDSAFVTQPDPLNAPDKKPEGESTQAAIEDAAGFGESAPKTVPKRAKADVERSAQRRGATPAILEGDPNFETVPDPGPFPAIPSSFDAIPEGNITHDQTLAAAKAKAATQDKPNFNTTGEVDFGPDPLEKRIASLREKLLDESDPRQVAQLQAQVEVVERQLGIVQPPGYAKFVKTMNGYTQRINHYEGLLKRHPDRDRIGRRVAKVKQYVGYITNIRPKDSRYMLEIWNTAKKQADRILERTLRTFPVKKRDRPSRETGVKSPKRQKTGSEAARAAAGRSSETGEPPRQRRSTRLQERAAGYNPSEAQSARDALAAGKDT